MKKAICPITKKVFDCQNCTAIKDEACVYWEFDECVDHTLKFLRELVEKEQNEKK
ncbi:MAG: hypothetical protein V1709_06415 [Planctomycetota bacterium]